METRNRTQQINQHLESILIEKLTGIVAPLGKHGIKRVYDILELMCAGNEDSLTEEDQKFATEVIEAINPYFDLYNALSPTARKKIKEAIRENLYGGKK